MKKANAAFVKIVVALPITPQAAETDDKTGALMFVVATLMELGMLRLNRPVMVISGSL
jgi:hypothetical protein